MQILQIPMREAFTYGGCSFRKGVEEVDFQRLTFTQTVKSNPFEIISLGDAPVPISNAKLVFLHCLSGVVAEVSSGLRLATGDFLIKTFEGEESPRFYALEGPSLLSVVRLPEVDAAQAARTAQLRNVSEAPYQPRPNRITLKSLLVGTPYELAVGYEFVEMPRNAMIDVHVHPQSDAIVFMVQGSGSFIVEDTELLVAQGVHGFIARGEKHGVRSGSEGMNFISVQIPPIGGKGGYIFSGRHPQPRRLVRFDPVVKPMSHTLLG